MIPQFTFCALPVLTGPAGTAGDSEPSAAGPQVEGQSDFLSAINQALKPVAGPTGAATATGDNSTLDCDGGNATLTGIQSANTLSSEIPAAHGKGSNSSQLGSSLLAGGLSGEADLVPDGLAGTKVPARSSKSGSGPSPDGKSGKSNRQQESAASSLLSGDQAVLLCQGTVQADQVALTPTEHSAGNGASAVVGGAELNASGGERGHSDSPQLSHQAGTGDPKPEASSIKTPAMPTSDLAAEAASSVEMAPNGVATANSATSSNGNAAFAVPSNWQVVDSEDEASLAVSASAGAKPRGTGSALNTPRMKFAAQTNENAESTVQKLPRAAAARLDASSLDGKSSAKTSFSRQSEKDATPSLPVFSDFGAKSSAQTLSGTGVTSTEVSYSDSASHVEKVADLVAQEAVTIRQSGATNLAVTLKLDSHTEVFVQLTNHDGQIQASVRCERGSLPGLETHWGQLQESLARQNVQLLPAAERVVSRDPASSDFSNSSASRDSQQSFQQQNHPAPQSRATLSAADSTTAAAPSRSGKTRPTSRQGWESWA